MGEQGGLAHHRHLRHRLAGGPRCRLLVGLELLVQDWHRVGSDALAQFCQLGVEPEIVSGMGCKVSQALHCKESTLDGTAAIWAICCRMQVKC